MALTAEQIKKILENPISAAPKTTVEKMAPSPYMTAEQIGQIMQDTDAKLKSEGKTPTYTYKDLKTQSEKNWASVGQNIVQGLGDASAALAQTGKAISKFDADTNPIRRGINELVKGSYSLLPEDARSGLEYLGVDPQKPQDWLYDITIKSNQYGEQQTQKANAEADEAVRLINNWLVRPVANALPNTVFALMTGGSSTAAQLGTQSAGVVGQVSTQLLTNPQFYASAAQTFGPTYYDALESGATEQQAMWTALLNSALGSTIEVGATPDAGGLETFLKSQEKGLLEFVKSIPEEGAEEVLQGMLERFLQKTVAGDEETKWFSTDPNEKAVFNPSASAQEFAGGAIVGGVLGGTTYTINTVINNVNKAKTGSGLDYATLAQNTAAKVGIEETVAAEVAEIAKFTKTPVVWVDAIGNTPDGGVINGVFKDNVMVLAANGTGDKRTVAAHELTHSIEGTAAYQNIVNEIAVDRKSNDAASLDAEAAGIQALYREQLGMDITIEKAKAEAVARYVEQRLDTSPAVIAALRSYNGGVFARMLQNRRYNQQYKAADEATRQQLRLQRNVAEGIRQRPRTNITPEQIRAVLERVKNGETDGARMSIQYTTDNAPVVVIEDNILDGVPQSKWIDKVKETISDKFSMGIPVSGRLIKVNQKTRNEYTKSKYSQRIESQSPVVYEDKFKAAGNLDEIVLASTNYVNEDLKHKRKDNFKEFARGNVLIRVGKNDYDAKVIVGFTTGGNMVLYDVVDFTPTTLVLKTKKVDTRFANQTQNTNAQIGSNVSTNTNIAQNAPGVNTQYTQNNDPYSISSVTDELLKPYIEKYGGMKLDRPRETPVKVNEDGKVVSQGASTMLNSTQDETALKATVEQIINDQLSQKPTNLQKEREKADRMIESMGYEAAAKEAAASVENGYDIGEFSVEQFIRYAQLRERAIVEGDADTIQNAQTILVNLASVSGKILRAQRDILMKGLDGYHRGKTIDKVVKKINENQSARWIEKHGEVKIPQELRDSLDKATTPEEIATIEKAIYKAVADQMPPTFWEKWMNYRYLAMLGNPKTWIKNEAGNWSNYGLSHIDNLMAVTVQRIFKAVSKKVEAEGAASFNWTGTAIGRQIEAEVNKAAVAAAEKESNHKYQSNPENAIQEERAKFGKSFIGKGLTAASDFTDAVMQNGMTAQFLPQLAAGDKAMFKRLWKYFAGNMMVAQNLTEITPAVEQHATKMAQEYVFHSNNAISEAVSALKRKNKYSRAVVDSLMPFVRTPANVMQQGFERSPLGLAVNGVKLVKEINGVRKKGGKVTAETINRFSRGITGTMLWALGMALASLGIVTGEEDDSEKGRIAGELAGDQALSFDFNVMGTKISFDWLEPASYPFMVGVLLQTGIDKEDVTGSLFDALCAGYNEIFNMSMLSGLLDAFTTPTYGDEGSGVIGKVLSSVATNSVTQSIPTLVGQLARSIDPVKRKTTSGESWVTDTFGDNFASDTISTVLARIPWASTTLEAERDVFGNEVGRVGDKDNVVLNAVQQFLSPAAITRKGGTDQKTDNVTAALLELYESTGQGKVIPSEIKAKDFKEKLSDEGLADAYTSKLYQETRVDVGQAQLEAIWEMIEQNKSVELTKTYETAAGKEKRRTYSKRFDDMTDEEKVKAVSKVATAAKHEYIEDLIDELEKRRKTQ